MKSNKLLAAGILLLSTASIAAPSMAGEHGKGCQGKYHGAAWGGHEGFEGRDFRHVSKALELTEAQKETLKTQREADKVNRKALHAKVVNARAALAAAGNAGANDAELNALAETLGDLHAQQAVAGIKAQKAFNAVLTEEQKKTLAELKSQRHERRESRKETREMTKS